MFPPRLGTSRALVPLLVRVCTKDLIGFPATLRTRYAWFDYVCLHSMINAYFRACPVFYSVSNRNNFWYVTGLSVEHRSAASSRFTSFFAACITTALFHLSFVLADLPRLFVSLHALDEYNVVNEICASYTRISLLIALLHPLGASLFHFCNCSSCEMDIEDNSLVLFISTR